MGLCNQCYLQDACLFPNEYRENCKYFSPIVYWEQSDNDLIWYCSNCGIQIIAKEDLPDICPNCEESMKIRSNYGKE